MSRNLTPALSAYFAGQSSAPLGYRRNGAPIWPIAGGSPDSDDPQRPDDIPEETWTALGDPGKRALVTERSARQEAERARDTAVRERDAARARPAAPGAQQQAGSGGQPTEQQITEQGGEAFQKMIADAVQAAVKPFQDREQQRDTEAAAQKVRDAVVDAAKPLLHDPTDALAKVDLTTIVDEQGRADTEKVKKALEQVVAASPHLAKSTSRVAPTGIGGGGAPITGATEGERVKSLLAQMQTSAGVRVPTTTTT